MPTLNRKLLLRLFLATLVLGVGLFLLHHVQSDRTKDALRWQAERAADSGKLDKAILYMRQYLELRPEDHDAAVTLGDMILTRGTGQKELASALFLFERVLREAPQREDVRRKLVGICLRLNRHADALIHAKALLQKSPNEADLWEKLGVCHAAQNKPDEARTSFEKAIESDAQRVRSYELLAELFVRQFNLPDAARDCLDKMVSANPTRGEAYLVRARFLRSQRKAADCQRDLDKVLEIEPGHPDALLITAELLQEKGEIAKARAVLAEGRSRHPKDVRYYRALSWVELSSGNLAAATACLEQGIKELPHSAELLTPLGDLLVQQGQIERVQAIIKKLEGRRNVASQLRYLRGRVLLQEGKWAEAAAMLEGLRTEAVAMPGLAAQVNFLLALCHEHLGDRDAFIEALKRVLQIDAGHLNARLKFGTLHLSAGNLGEAIREYVVAARSPYAPLGSRIMLGRMLIARVRSSGSAAEWNNVAEYVQLLRDAYKSSVEPVLLAAEMHAAHQQPDLARKLLRAEAGKKVNDARIWSVLAALALESDGLHAALEVIEEAQALVGDQAELRLARARTWAADGLPGREQRIRALGRGADEFPDSEQLRLLAGLADVCASINDLDGVKLFQKQVAAKLPRDLSIRRALFDVGARTGDVALMTQLRGEMAKFNTVDACADVADALAAIDAMPLNDARLASAQSLARRVLAASPDRADAHLLAAKLAEKAGDRTAAAKHFGLAVEFERTSIKHLQEQLAYLVRSGDDTAARRKVEQLFADPRLPGDAFLALVETVTSRLTPEQGDKCLAWVSPLIQKSGVSLLRMARLEQKRGHTPAAMTLVNQAVTTSPKLIDAWAARIRLKPEEAPMTLRSARTALDDSSFYLLCAEVADDLRKTKTDWTPPMEKPEQRRLIAQAFMTALGARGKYAEATEVLNQLAGDAMARPEDIAWAKRNRAMLAAARGSAQARKQAIAALKNSPAESADAVEDLRSRVTALAVASRHLNGTERKAAIQQAIDALKRVVADKDATAKDWYHLAQFQRLAGDRPAQLESLKEAMRRDEGNLFYAVASAEELIADGKLEEAAPLVPRLLQATHDPRAVAAAARFFAGSNQPDKALEAINLYIGAADAGTPEEVIRSRLAADILDQTCRVAAAKKAPCAKTLLAAAIEKYRAVINNYPEAAGPLAALLAFDNQTQAALDFLTQMKSSLSAKTLTTAGLSVVRHGNATPRQFLLVKSWLEAALQDNSNSINLQMNLAELHAMRLDYAAAEPIYRKILKDEPDNIVALNNLAWILAPRAEAAEEALRCVQKAIELVGPSGELLDTRARILIARGDVDRAIEDLNQALTQSQTSLRHFHLAIAQFKKLNKDEAVKSFKQARAQGLDQKSIHPSDVPTYKVLASSMNEN